jgi:hypothetical protein
VPIGITVGTPRRLALPYADRLVFLREAAPFGLLQIDDEAEFERRYVERLNAIGVAVFARRFTAIARAAGSPALVLLCFEDVTKGQSCHRTTFSRWWERQTEDVPVAVDFRDGGPGVMVTSLRR